MRRRQRPSTAQRRADEQDDRPREERVWPIRWGRVVAGLAMIAIAIIWLILDNHFGIVDSTRVATPTAILSKAVPAVATPQASGAITVNVKVAGSETSIGGLHAPAGSHYLIVAVQVINRGAAAIRVAPSAFHLRVDDRDVASGFPYPGQNQGLFAAPVPPGRSATGVFLALRRDDQGPAILAFIPSFARGSALLWRLS